MERGLTTGLGTGETPNAGEEALQRGGETSVRKEGTSVRCLVQTAKEDTVEGKCLREIEGKEAKGDNRAKELQLSRKKKVSGKAGVEKNWFRRSAGYSLPVCKGDGLMQSLVSKHVTMSDSPQEGMVNVTEEGGMIPLRHLRRRKRRKLTMIEERSGGWERRRGHENREKKLETNGNLQGGEKFLYPGFSKNKTTVHTPKPGRKYRQRQGGAREGSPSYLLVLDGSKIEGKPPSSTDASKNNLRGGAKQ